MNTSVFRHERAPDTILYIIQEGDTLWGIAKRFNTLTLHIIEVNPNLNPYTLFPGQIIYIPKV